MVRGAVLWAKVEDRDVQLPAPDKIRRQRVISSWTKLNVSELLIWAVSGTFTEEERTALSNST